MPDPGPHKIKFILQFPTLSLNAAMKDSQFSLVTPLVTACPACPATKMTAYFWVYNLDEVSLPLKPLLVTACPAGPSIKKTASFGADSWKRSLTLNPF